MLNALPGCYKGHWHMALANSAILSAVIGPGHCKVLYSATRRECLSKIMELYAKNV